MTPDTWHAHAQRTLEREQRREPPPATEGEITTESALAGIAEVAHLLRDGGWVAEDMGTGWSQGK